MNAITHRRSLLKAGGALTVAFAMGLRPTAGDSIAGMNAQWCAMPGACGLTNPPCPAITRALTRNRAHP